MKIMVIGPVAVDDFKSFIDRMPPINIQGRDQFGRALVETPRCLSDRAVALGKPRWPSG